ncbi:MAG: peptidoglycan editing factor PgeF [Gammaproteobacteria bacterium]
MPVITPQWSAPSGVRALSTMRDGGVSGGQYASLNLGDHVDDQPAHVKRNRELLATSQSLPGPVRWLNQVHGVDVARGAMLAARPTADASITTTPGEVLAILTADCLPVLLAKRDASAVGAAHAGWRSLVAGVLENTLDALGGTGADYVAWLGPAISQPAFEVGDDVRAAFVAHDSGAEIAFAPNAKGRWQADLYTLARQRLKACGVAEISGGDACTWSNPDRFFSYRRDGQCGRMASLIWIAK